MIIREGISEHRFYTTIWFNVDKETGEIESVEYDNAFLFKVKIQIWLDGKFWKRHNSTSAKGTIPIPPGYFLTKKDDGFDAPDTSKLAYRFEVVRF